MSKVDWINWKTDVRELVVPEREFSRIKDNFDQCYGHLKSIVYDDFSSELRSGGLNNNSMFVFGEAPLYEMTIKIQNRINTIKDSMDELLDIINSNLNDQKQIEKKQLIIEIEKKIEEEKKKLLNSQSLSNKISSINKVVSQKQLEDIIEITQERIHILERKLEQVQEF